MIQMFIVIIAALTIFEGIDYARDSRKFKVTECIDQQVLHYDDLCAEESSGYESMSPENAHFEGVKCTVESIKMCLSAMSPGQEKLSSSTGE